MPTEAQVESWIQEKLTGKQLATARAALKRLLASHGVLTPQIVLEAARSQRSALHRLFEWDDTAAAEKFRLTQARNLIRTVRVVITAPNTEPREVRAYVSPAHGQGYYGIATVLSKEELRLQLLAQAMREMEAFQRKYATIQELSDVLEAMDSVLRRKKARRKSA